ncbi:MAG: Sensors of blue-light using FAD, partial [uncultured Ramlibacter sp.]
AGPPSLLQPRGRHRRGSHRIDPGAGAPAQPRQRHHRHPLLRRRHLPAGDRGRPHAGVRPVRPHPEGSAPQGRGAAALRRDLGAALRRLDHGPGQPEQAESLHPAEVFREARARPVCRFGQGLAGTARGPDGHRRHLRTRL